MKLTDDQREALKHLVARGSTFPDHNGAAQAISRVDYNHLATAAKVLSDLLAAHPVADAAVAPITFDVSMLEHRQSTRTTYHVYVERSDRNTDSTYHNDGYRQVFVSEKREEAETERAAWDAFLTGSHPTRHFDFIGALITTLEKAKAAPIVHDSIACSLVNGRGNKCTCDAGVDDAPTTVAADAAAPSQLGDQP